MNVSEILILRILDSRRGKALIYGTKIGKSVSNILRRRLKLILPGYLEVLEQRVG